MAIKTLTRELVQHPSSLARFGREAQLMKEHPHPCVVPLHSAHLRANPPYLVLEWMAGGALRARLEEGPLSHLEVARVGVRIGEALAHLHGLGALHRDVKPENILFDDAGQAYLADLGLVGLPGSALTATGKVAGTLRYLAPERLRGEDATARTDLFALGVVLVEALCGERPEVQATSVTLPGCLGARAQGLAPLLRRLLRTEASGRPQRAEDVVEELRRFLAAGPQVAAPVVGASDETRTEVDLVQLAPPGASDEGAPASSAPPQLSSPAPPQPSPPEPPEPPELRPPALDQPAPTRPPPALDAVPGRPLLAWSAAVSLLALALLAARPPASPAGPIPPGGARLSVPEEGGTWVDGAWRLSLGPPGAARALRLERRTPEGFALAAEARVLGGAAVTQVHLDPARGAAAAALAWAGARYWLHLAEGREPGLVRE